MKNFTKSLLTATTIILTATMAQARDQIRIVGSSTVYPFATIVAEKFGQGTDFYTQNPIFWTKIIFFAFVGTLSLYPTITYILWAIPLSKGNLPEVTSNLVSRLKLILNKKRIIVNKIKK